MAQINLPGLVSRRRYILEQARARGLAFTAEVTESLAATADGYRTLDGWLTRLALQTKVKPHSARVPGHLPGGNRTGSTLAILDIQAMMAILREETELLTSRLTVEQITRAVAVQFGMHLSVLRGPGRHSSIVEARHLAMHLARLHTGLSFTAIGTYFGGRDPATVRHACKVTAERLDADPALAAIAASFGQGRR